MWFLPRFHRNFRQYLYPVGCHAAAIFVTFTAANSYLCRAGIDGVKLCLICQPKFIKIFIFKVRFLSVFIFCNICYMCYFYHILRLTTFSSSRLFCGNPFLEVQSSRSMTTMLVNSIYYCLSCSDDKLRFCYDSMKPHSECHYCQMDRYVKKL